MNLEQIMKRLKEIEAEAKRDGADIDALTKETEKLLETKRSLEEKGEERTALLDKIANGTAGIEVRTFNEPRNVPENLGYDSEEYRSAFFKDMLGLEMTEAEERAFIHTTQNTDAVVPKETMNKIFTNMEEQHPILADVNILRTGTIITIVKHISIDSGDAKAVAEGTANDDEKNTFKQVTLTGKDIVKTTKYSYRLKQMSIPAFEDYIVKEIGDRISSAWAKAIIEQIKNDLNTANKIQTKAALAIGDVLKGLSTLKGAEGKVYVYANSAGIYNHIATMKDADTKVNFIPDFSQNIAGTLLGKAMKEEDAMGDNEILILAPSQYTENVAQDLLIESDKIVETHTHIISGIVITGGTMTNDKGGALITVGAGA